MFAIIGTRRSFKVGNEAAVELKREDSVGGHQIQ